MNPLSSAVLLAVILLACGPGVGPGGDADADAGDAGDAGARPDIPWLEDGTPPIAPPLLTPCPEGWHEVVQGDPDDPDGEMDIVTCDPYGTEPGGTEPDTCPAGQVHFMGDPGCTPVGAPCPAGDFPEGLPSGRAVLYVLASAPPGGDGSEASPLSTITEAVALASPGNIVAIGKGEYDEALRLPPAVTLWGACATETRLTASSWGLLAKGVITVPSPDTRVVNLWVGPAEIPGIVAYGDRASLSVDGVIIDGTRTYGLRMTTGGRVDGRELVVSGTRADDDGLWGRGIVVESGSTLDLQRAAISQNHEMGIGAAQHGTSVTLSDVVIHDTQPQRRNGTAGRGLNIQGGATATVTRALLSRNHGVGVYAAADDTSLTLSDMVIRDTQPQPDGTGGRGLNVQEGATAAVTRALLSQNREIGIYAGDDGTSLTLSDMVIRDTQARLSNDTGGRGLSLQAGVAVTVTRVLLSRNHELGVYAADDGTSLTLSDVVIRDTQARQSDGIGGRGLNVHGGATVTVTHALFARNHAVGVMASGDGLSLTLSDVVIRDTQARESDGTMGRGLGVQRGAAATVTRALLTRNRDLGIVAYALGAVELLDVVVTQTDEQACADTTCTEEPYGMGLAAVDEATLSATRFSIQDAALCGVMVAADAQIDLAVGEVSGSQVGVCLQVDGYDVPRLTDRVRFVDNETNLDTTSLPVPEPVRPID